jgi:hypothetical protein
MQKHAHPFFVLREINNFPQNIFINLYFETSKTFS